MLALKSYEQASGFSVIDADELFYINGGSGASSSANASTSTSVSISNGSNQGYVNNPGKMIATTVIAWAVTLDNPSSHTQAVAQGWYTTMGGTYGNAPSSGGASGSGGGK